MKTTPNPYSGYRHPGEIISHAVWLYFRFALSFRDIEEILAARGILVSYEAVRPWSHQQPVPSRTPPSESQVLSVIP